MKGEENYEVTAWKNTARDSRKNSTQIFRLLKGRSYFGASFG